jgi:hypothetical protein
MYQKLRFLLVAACLLPTALMPSASLAASSPEPPVPIHLAQNTYSREFLRGFMDSCISGIVNRNIPRESAISYCQCFIERAQLIYTQEQLSQLSQNASLETLPPEIISIGSTCSTNILN